MRLAVEKPAMANQMTDEITAARVRKIHEQIRPHILRTPLLPSKLNRPGSPSPFHIKLENRQHTGSFKIRGALAAVAGVAEPSEAHAVVTASAGNHGLGLARACELFGLQSHIYVPIGASRLKMEKLRAFDGVQLSQVGDDYDEAQDAALAYAADRRLPYVHAFDDPVVICGQGTVGVEVLDDLPEVAQIVVPVGGGGLISGLACLAKAERPGVRVVGVQSEASPAMVRALEAGRPVDTPIGPTIADGLAGRLVTERTLACMERWVDEMILVSEDEIEEAVRRVFEVDGERIEGSGAAGVAAVLSGKVDLAPGPAVAAITGGNIDPDLHSRICGAEVFSA